jgi:hypothetical protein
MTSLPTTAAAPTSGLARRWGGGWDGKPIILTEFAILGLTPQAKSYRPHSGAQRLSRQTQYFPNERIQ